ncbi:MAG: DUF11 domain-containing protein [Chryseobacterium sp.]|nr:MAG: DUF11 domain-containing protein [Chryseobacterium sp.]
MFRKLVSNLSFSPSLINQLSFYSKRLRKEQFTRKIGLVATILAIIVQSFTFLVPAEATLASSPNDIINGGGNLQYMQSIINSERGCDRMGRCDVKQIFAAYGITPANLAQAKEETIQATTANNYWSIGRAQRSYGGQNIPKRIPGTNTTVYARTLHGWSGGMNKNWRALRVETSQGTRWILKECGNIVTKESTPKPQNPDMKITKTVNKTQAKKGEKVTFTIQATNIGNATAKNVLIFDDAPVGLDLLNDGLATDPIKSPRRWEASRRLDIPAGKTYTYRINALVTKWGPVTLTNKACVDFFDINIWNNCDDATVTVPQGCPIPGKENLPKSDPQCKTNPGLAIEKTASNKNLKVGDTFDYVIKITNNGDVNLPGVFIADKAPSEIEFLEVKEPGKNAFTPVKDAREYISIPFSLNKGASTTATLRAKVIAKSKTDIKNTACVASTGNNTTTGGCDDETVTVKDVCPTNSSLPNDSKDCQPPCPIEGKENLPQNSPECKPCDETKQTEDGKDISCLELSKKARNITQQLQDANGTQANAGDTIEYTLSVTNMSKLVREGFVVEENLEDVLEYADIIDASGATFTDNPVKMLSWSPVDIRPNETITRTILIKIKSEIPATPASTSDPLSYDMKLINVYGNSIEINLPPNPIKTVEQTVTTLPATGLGVNVAISTFILVSATYFYTRSRVLGKEVGLVRKQFNYGMGV